MLAMIQYYVRSVSVLLVLAPSLLILIFYIVGSLLRHRAKHGDDD
jgi:hypothetical protein